MNQAAGRFNLRARKTLKLLGQVQCISCTRYFFPPEYVDDEKNAESGNESEHICCDCEQKKQVAKMKLAKKVRQHKNAASSTTTIKIEKIEPIEILSDLSIQPIQSQNNQNNGSNFRPECMVQIHLDELITQPPAILNSNRKLICII